VINSYVFDFALSALTMMQVAVVSPTTLHQLTRENVSLLCRLSHINTDRIVYTRARLIHHLRT
jgi:hypothetical protein